MRQERYSSRRRRRRGRAGAMTVSVLIFIAAVVLVVLIMKLVPAGGVQETVDEPQASEGISDTKTEAAVLDIDPEDWRLMLVNDANPLPSGYTPKLSTLPNGLEFDSRAIDDLNKMIAGAKEDGYTLVICSAYRSVAYQSELFQQQVQKQQAQGNLDYEDAVAAAKTVVTYPGCSEHNLGLAADIVCEAYQLLDEGFAKRDEAKWLKAHCAEYGFILRYPADKLDETGVIYESWHFRYVGQEAAAYIMENNLCLEEYLALAG